MSGRPGAPLTEVERLRRKVEDLKQRLEDAEYRIRTMTEPGPKPTVEVPGKGEVRAPKRLRTIFNLLKAQQGSIVRRESLLAAICDEACGRDTPEMKIIDVYVSHVRKLVEGSQVRIDTVWGVGYKMVPRAAVDGV